MSIYRRVEKLILREFNEKNGHNLLPEHVRFTNPRPADSGDPTMAAVYNTAVSLEMLKGCPFDGVATLFYNRVVLSAEFSVSRLLDLNYIKIQDERTTRELVPYINTKLGLHLRPEDVVEEELNDRGLFTQVRIRITEGSLEFTGSFDLGIMRVNAPLVKLDAKHSVVFVEDAGRKAIYPGRPEAPVFPLTYGIDYTAAYADLRRVKVPKAWGAFPTVYTNQAAVPYTPDHLANVLNTIDNYGWRSNQAATTGMTLNQAMPLYNGPTKDCLVPDYAFLGITAQVQNAETIWSNPANLDYDNVLVLMIHNPWYTNGRYKSLALFHYNEVRK